MQAARIWGRISAGVTALFWPFFGQDARSTESVEPAGYPNWASQPLRMKQILQNMSNGVTELAEVPCPQVRSGALLIRTERTLVSAGTERMLVEFGKASLIEKARQQPDKVRQVFDKIKTDGLMPTLDAVRSKLDQPLPLGYCNAGVVLEVGSGVTEFQPGDRVVSNGGHAEVVSIGQNLCAKIPEGVTDEEAAFTVLGSIGLQGIRLLNPTLGESFVVTGAGLIGLMCVQMLRANGCRVLAIDFDSNKLALAKVFGAEVCDLSTGGDPEQSASSFSRGKGVDGVVITASTKSSEPMTQAAHMCRKRGRIVLVGVTGLELSRADFYEKELTFQVSCSYGPGRYDSSYEEKGTDYPLPFVRWTEQRNFEAVLDLMASGQMDVKPLISHRFKIADGESAYATLSAEKAALGIVLEYAASKTNEELRNPVAEIKESVAESGAPTVSFIGAGNYAGRVLIPAFQKGGAQFRSVASSGGVTAQHFAKKYGFSLATTDTAALLNDAGTSAVAIATRHNTHARFTLEALKAGKHVFCEKPICLSDEELEEISRAYSEAGKLVMVGFNRRFAPHIVKMKQLLVGASEAKAFVMTVNAGAIPANHWTQDPTVGGGRFVGEGCHFVDLLRFLAGCPIVSVQAMTFGQSATTAVKTDKCVVTLGFSDGSIGTIQYLANGHGSFPKERLEVFCGERVLQMDNYRTLSGFGWPGFSKMKISKQDKGQDACAAAFVEALKTGRPSPISFTEIAEVHRICFEADRLMRHN